MFEIDLKAGAARRESPESRTSSAMAFAPVGLAIAAGILVLWTVGWRWDASLALRRDQAARLQANTEQSRQKLTEISGKRRALFAIQQSETYWSDQLRTLAERIPDKIWIARVAVVTSGGEEGGPPMSRTLSIEGGVLSSESEGNLDLIGKFIQDLQHDRRFRESFGDVELRSVTREGSGQPALTFVLQAPLRS